MSVEELVRSWKDEDYRLSMSAKDRPEHPAGNAESEVYQSADVGNSCEVTSCVHFCSYG